jgi:hypothetical protein
MSGAGLYEKLKDDLGYAVVGAIVDRLMHDAIVFNIQGPSWRMREHRALTEATRNGPERRRR